jgi:biopolymer transport protein ExbD
MAQLDNAAFKRKGKSFCRNKKEILKIDMTPMVDLGFLLITFFVFTTTISTPAATDLYMPKPGPESEQPNSLALTLLLDENNKVYYYNGNWDDARKTNEIFETNYSTYAVMGKIIRQKQKDIDASEKFADGKRGLMLLIKPTSKSVYKNVIAALDEAMINDVKKYAILDLTAEELDFLKAKSRQ